MTKKSSLSAFAAIFAIAVVLFALAVPAQGQAVVEKYSDQFDITGGKVWNPCASEPLATITGGMIRWRNQTVTTPNGKMSMHSQQVLILDAVGADGALYKAHEIFTSSTKDVKVGQIHGFTDHFKIDRLGPAGAVEDSYWVKTQYSVLITENGFDVLKSEYTYECR